MPDHSSLAIANEFIKRAQGNPAREVTQMKLQKLVYLAHGWSLAGVGKPIIADSIEAWDYGPVIPKLYHALKTYGKHPIRELLRWGQDTDFVFDDDGIAHEPLETEEQVVIDQVWNTYGRYPAFKLSALTHQEGTPWTQKFVKGRNNPIPNELIRDHFTNLLAPAA